MGKQERGKAYHRDKEESKFISRLKKHLYYAWLEDSNGLPIKWGHEGKITWKDLIGKRFFRNLRKTRKIDTNKWEQFEQKTSNKRDRHQAKINLKYDENIDNP